MPRITPTPVIIAGVVIVGEPRVLADASARRLNRLRQAEVQHLHRTVATQLDVRGLQVAMDDALLVRRFQRVGHLLRDGSASSTGIAALAIRSASVGPSTSSMTRAVTPSLVFEAVDLRDVRMIEGGEHLRFTREARQAIGIVGEGRQQDLDRDVALQLRVEGV